MKIMEYTNFGQKQLKDNEDNILISEYNNGFVLTRINIGFLVKVRSIRINLHKFLETSENKRILKKFNHKINIIPLPLDKFNSKILILAKSFYDNKFGKNIFSGTKIKELLTQNSNFNALLAYENEQEIEGYCFCKIIESKQKIIHYAYPFYSLNKLNTNFGMYMMTLAIKYFHEKQFDYIYLGSCHDEKCKYKLQFKGVEWFNEENNIWEFDISKLKKLISNN